MLINNIRVNGYGNLKDIDIPLQKGINIVYGHNASRQINICFFY